MSEKTMETSEKKEKDEDPPEPIKPYCPVTVEPALGLVVVAAFMTATLRQQYLFYRLLGATGTVNQQGGACSSGGNMGNITNASVAAAAAAAVQKAQMAQAGAIQWATRLKLADSIPALIVTLLIGPLSDKLGRKLNLIIPISGLLVEALLGALTTQLTLPLAVFIAAELASGFTGGSQNMIGGGFAYIADITGEGRARYFRHAVLQAAFGIAVVIAALGGNYWFQRLGFPVGVSQPFWFAVGAIGFSLLYTIFALKETCPRKPGTRLCSLSNITGIVQLFRAKRKTPTWPIAVLTLALFLIFSVANSAFGIIFTFVLGPPFCWPPTYLGYFQLAIGAGAVVSMVAIRIFSKYPYGMLMASYASGIGANVLMGLSTYAPNPTVAVFMVPVVGVFHSAGQTLLRTVMSKMVRQDEQGSLFGLLTFATQLAVVALVPLWNFVYAQTILIMPGLVFFILAGVVLISAMLTGCVKYCLTDMDEEKVEEVEKDAAEKDGVVNAGMLNDEQCVTKL